MIIEYWGETDYRGAWERQKDIFRELQNDITAPERLVFTEHKPVYTLGFHGNAANMTASEEALRSRGAELVRIERGGDITYHGPGQLVAYPLLRLSDHHMGVRQYVEWLEHLVMDTLKEFGIQSSCNRDAIGVWIDWGKPSARKICAIGVKISHGVTMHGLALNVSTDLTAFSLINPCGFTDKGVTSIEKEIGHPVRMTDVIATMCRKINLPD